MNDKAHPHQQVLSASISATNPKRLGLTLEPGGWVPIDALLAACRRSRAVRSLATNSQRSSRRCDKQRFAFDETGTRIRANQGHSTEVDLQLEPPSRPPAVTTARRARISPPFLATACSRWPATTSTSRPILPPPQGRFAARQAGRSWRSTRRRMRGRRPRLFRSANGVWLVETRSRREYLRLLSPGERNMPPPIQHARRTDSQRRPRSARQLEPRALRTYTPTQAVLAQRRRLPLDPRGRRLYDFTSGVLVSNLGHNPTRWMQRFASYMGWPAESDSPMRPRATSRPCR